MSDFGTARLENKLDALADEYPHLREHLEWFYEEYNEYPKLIDEPSSEWESHRPNVIYVAEEPIFCHVYGDLGISTTYYCVEPTLEGEDEELYDRIRRRILDKSVTRPAPGDNEEFEEHLDELLDDVVEVTSGITGQSIGRLKSFGTSKISLSQDQFDRLRYQLQRDIVGLGPLEPVMTDPANEDIHVIGPKQCYLDHGTYGMIEATVDFGTPEEFEQWLRNMGERMNHPVSDSDPVIDATLPDGSRINIIYSDDVSVQGPSLTIRQGEEIPLSVFQITKWGTISPELAAYLWLCLENEQTVFVVGETASGKTTTLNAALSFIPRDAKIYTAEDTAEVIPPHDTWQQLLTREGSGDESADVDMFDLVAAALRSRPDYIIVGEVRGAEGQMAFQAAQTGHPVMLTFHASDIVSMIQRFTGAPINVPETFMDNCDVALFQNRVKQGDDVLRRVTSVQEIEGYSDYEGGVVTRQAFKWDPRDDDVSFTGRNNSYVLEEQIATLLGYEDTREIYDELDRRAEIIRQLIDADILGYHEVNKAIADFQRDGIEGLPIRIRNLNQFA
ncbi:Flp pilus assembly complex ATPase component TadA [Haloterrigena sp. SYSU A558-1]|uniref:Flp pilus assembly complex ATPase component TadA n=1 Tax=Haloterrigena gelatinilytica TaxID=2741724 RepID=A0A8J8GHZ1_9EURY|nr:type II/IV secretion system ATPase subunit [Haloterrigena gelatinilytica]NUB89718.1 Flp pilus assembly complex ATPase component TadA [Haloterrigena gelatinilytica]NUC74451.1 Flp pilus assembly complex ATPase component TadA [Haloterrigena gelatinilytica]